LFIGEAPGANEDAKVIRLSEKPDSFEQNY
jgi:hypothetical protein